MKNCHSEPTLIDKSYSRLVSPNCRFTDCIVSKWYTNVYDAQTVVTVPTILSKPNCILNTGTNIYNYRIILNITRVKQIHEQ